MLAYNWLIRRNKSISEDLAAFTNVHGYIMSNGAVKPLLASPKQPAQVAKPAPTASTDALSDEPGRRRTAPSARS